jgi:DNA-binding beta-propeller fold protein YncE
LHAPKGITLHENAVWVTDNQRVVRYALDGDATGEVSAIDGAKHLNDLASDGEAVYVSDSKRNTVHKLTESGVQGRVPAPRGINGLTLHKGALLGVSFATGEVYRLDKQGQAPPQPMGLADRFTALDGIEALADGTLIVSDFKGGRVAAISPAHDTVKTLAEMKTPADFGIDRDNDLLYVPSLRGNFVRVYRLQR